MGQFCVVYGCSNYSAKNKGKAKSFFRIPAIVKHHNDEKTQRLSEKRRKMWIMSINRKNWVPSKHSFVCSDHFVTGQPSRLYDTTHPDWIPTINMGKRMKNKTVKNSDVVMHRFQRYPNQRRLACRQDKEPNCIVKNDEIHSDSSSHSLEWLSCVSSPVNDIDVVPGISIQTTLTMSVIQDLEKKITILEAENRVLREELCKSQDTAD